jgi:hypothetical protein
MADPASSFRLAASLHKADYGANLQFCCDHYRSVSEVCRRLTINRQQFNRYLTGTASPSRHNHKVISGFFGLEDDELLTPHHAFAETFKRRRAAQDGSTAFTPPAGLLQTTSGSAALSLSPYQGYYFKYFHSYTGRQRIKRELAHWYYRGEILVSSVKQRYREEDDEEDESALRFITYRGVVGTLDDRLFTTDFQRGSTREVATMILYPKGRLLKRLHGMTIGVSHGTDRSIAAARVVMDFIGTEIDARAALSRLGTFDLDEPSVPDAIKRAIGNDMRADETLFLARP